MIDPDRIAALIARLQRQHDTLKSWRKVAALYPPIVKAGTVCRIAKGEYLPDDRKILRALGLIEKRRKATEYKAVAESYCEDCGTIWTGRQAHKDGREHAEKHCHRVRVTQTIMRVYEVTR